ncbi:MAG: hypothetical protein ACE37D_16490 [Pseudomonadales bacterium]
MLKSFVRVILLLAFVTPVAAESITYDQIVDSIEDAVEERTTEGRIEAIDLAARTGTIGGYRYHFGPSTLNLPLQVKLLGRNFGSLELLQVGMDVRVFYFEAPSEHRIATELIQIEAAEQH